MKIIFFSRWVTASLVSSSLFFALVCLCACSSTSQGNTQQATQSSLAEQSTDTSQHSPKNYGITDVVLCGLLDKSGILWFGTTREGLFSYDGKTFTNYTVENGLCSNKITAIIEDQVGDLWFGTDEGLCRFDRKNFTAVPIPWDGNKDLWGPGMNAKLVLSLIQDKKGNFWLGTWGGGAYRYDGKTFTSFLAEKGRIQADGLHHNVIQSILEDASGNIWFTSMTHGGVSKYDGNSLTHFMPSDGLSDDMVRCSLQDKAGNMWFGSLGNREGTLDRYDGKSFRSFNEIKDLCNSNVICMYEDKEGNLWLGSGRGPLCIYNRKTFTPFTTKKGRSFERISFIIEDATGNIWFGGNYGQLFRYDGNTVHDFTQKGN